METFLQNNWKALVIAFFCVGVAIFGLAYALSNEGETNLPSVEQWDGYFTVSHKLTAEEYWSYFYNDNGAANYKFDDISVQVTGKVREVVIEPSRSAILLETPSTTQSIECRFNSKEALENIRVGDRVAIVGDGKARLRPRTENVVMVNCRIQKSRDVD